MTPTALNEIKSLVLDTKVFLRHGPPLARISLFHSFFLAQFKLNKAKKSTCNKFNEVFPLTLLTRFYLSDCSKISVRGGPPVQESLYQKF